LGGKPAQAQADFYLKIGIGRPIFSDVGNNQVHWL
jgi:hypothetical protein